MTEKRDFHNVFSWGDEEKELVEIQTKFLKYFPQKGKVLDLGSGRGIFLDLLRKGNFKPIGVEMDETMHQVSTEKGHLVHKNDALSYLGGTDEKYDGIMASHIIEHMEVKDGVKFIELIKSHLNVNGVAIVITPRPGSLWSAENFWLDTTHVRPYPYMLMKKLFYPLEEIIGGIEPDSYVLKSVGKKAKIMASIRRRILGKELFDFVYGGGVSYIVVKKNE